MNVFDPTIEAADVRAGPAKRPDSSEAADAVRTLILRAGDDPDREGLRGTPKRVVRAYDEWFGGYREDPAEILSQVFEETGGYDGMVVLRGIRFHSFCEHHLAPIVGRAHVGYMPDARVVGISKLARVVDLYARRLQLQERLTAEIADALVRALRPAGAAVVVEAEHFCMSTRGVHKPGVTMVTSSLHGVFRTDAALRRDFMSAIGSPAGDDG